MELRDGTSHRARHLDLSTFPTRQTEEAHDHHTRTRPTAPVPVSGGQGMADRGEPGGARLFTMPAATSFDGRDHVISIAALWLHVRCGLYSAFHDHPGFVPGGYVASLTGQDLCSPGADPPLLAAELCTAGLWERADGGYRILDEPAVQEHVEHVRDFRERENQAATRQPRQAPGSRAGQGAGGAAAAATVPGMRFGQRTGDAAAASFRCAACGEMAAVVKVARAGTTVDMGPPLGPETYDRDAIVVDYFMGTASRFADPATLDAVHEALSSDAPDPVALRRIDWELAPFYGLVHD